MFYNHLNFWLLLEKAAGLVRRPTALMTAAGWSEGGCPDPQGLLPVPDRTPRLGQNHS